MSLQGSISVPILAPFRRPFGIISHTFYIPFSSINFKWKSHRFFIVFSSAKTRFSIVKQTVSTVFAFFEKVWKSNGFGIHFGLILGTFWHTFSILFRHRFSDAFLDAKNLEQIATWRILVGFWTKSYKPEGIPDESQTNPRRHFFRLFQEPSFGIDFWVILGRFGLHFWWFWDDNPTFFSYNSGLCNHTLAQFSTRDFNTVCHIFKFIFGYVWSYILWYLVYLVSLIGL